MSVIDRLSSSLGRKDQEPNKELAQELCEKRDEESIAQLVANLSNSDKRIQSDCIAVMEYIGYSNPELIAQYVDTFLQIVTSKNNRMVWGAMIALSTITLEKADDVFNNIDIIFTAIEHGSVITIDNGISVIAKVASANETYEKKLVPWLLEHLSLCRTKEVGQHAEKSIIAMNERNKEQFIQILSKRMEELSSSQKTRVRKVLKNLEKI